MLNQILTNPRTERADQRQQREIEELIRLCDVKILTRDEVERIVAGVKETR